MMYQDGEKILTRKDAKITKLQGLTRDEVREWIMSVKDIKPKDSEIDKILHDSAGNPMILDEWLRQPGDLNFDSIAAKKLCGYIIDRRNSLEEPEALNIDKISVLGYPIDDLTNFAKFLNIPVGPLTQFLDKLEQKGIFEKNSNREWFKHELVRTCIEKHLRQQIRISYNEEAANFYLSLIHDSGDRSLPYNIKLGYAYHLHQAGKHAESYKQNTELAKDCVRIGDLDRAERAYITAIEDTKHLENREDDEKKCIFQLARVLMMWNRYDEAYTNYKKLEEYFQRVGDTSFLPRVKFYLGLIHQYKGEFDKALGLLNESFSIAKERDIKAGKQIAIDETEYEKEAGLYDEYIPELYDDSLLFKEGLIWELNIGATDFYMGYTLYINGQIASALQWYNRSHQYAQAYHDQLGEAIVLTEMAHILHDQDKFDGALTIYQNFLKPGVDPDVEVKPLRKCLILFQIGGIYLNKNEYQKALDHYEESLKIACELGDKLSKAAILHQIGNVHFKKMDFPESLDSYHKSLEIKRNLANYSYGYQLHDVSKGVTMGQIGRAIIKSKDDDSRALSTIWKRKQFEALSYTWKAYSLFENVNISYYKMAQNDMQRIREELSNSEYENLVNEIKNHPIES